jgi:hypothetical protein
MAFNNEQHRNRYAEDAEHRAQKLAANQTYRDARRDELNALWREKWNTDPAFRANRKAGQRMRVLRKYGLTPTDYSRMLDEQRGLCAICRRKPARNLCIDHCHVTSAVRGLLCDGCNRGIGDFGDDAGRMRSASDYIDRARGVHAMHGNIVAVVRTAIFAVTPVPGIGKSGLRRENPPDRLSRPWPGTLRAGGTATAALRGCH